MKLKTVFLMTAALLCSRGLFALEELRPLQLPAPRTSGGKPLMQALSERKSTRDISGKELPPQLLSDLLWAAAGINRADSGKRTAPSARDWREISVYVATPKELSLYNAAANTLEPLVRRDIRLNAGLQPAALAAPVLLLYVADPDKMGGAKADMQDFYSGADTGFISQNVYLFSASEGLATVVMGGIDREAVSKEMGLRAGQKVVLVQAVGYPKPEEKPAAKPGSVPASGQN